MLTRESKGKDKLDIFEIVQLAGAIWSHGAIHMDFDPRPSRNTASVRICITMNSKILYDYVKFTGGNIYALKNGLFLLDIHAQDLVYKRLREIHPYLKGVEKEQINIALELLTLLKSKARYNQEDKKQMKVLYDKWIEQRNALDHWINDFNLDIPKQKKVSAPYQIWSRTHKLSTLK